MTQAIVRGQNSTNGQDDSQSILGEMISNSNKKFVLFFVNASGPGLELQRFDTVLGSLKSNVDGVFVIAVEGALDKTLETQLNGILGADSVLKKPKMSDVMEMFKC